MNKIYNETKIVKKPWGQESWLLFGSQNPYAIKKILFKAGLRTSLQVHKFKFETNYVLFGTGKLLVSKCEFNIDNFLEKGMTPKEVEELESTLDVIDLSPGIHFSINPLMVHRVVAITDLEFIEVSTTELDDVYRLQDDQGRTHGKILAEHE